MNVRLMLRIKHGNVRFRFKTAELEQWLCLKERLCHCWMCDLCYVELCLSFVYMFLWLLLMFFSQCSKWKTCDLAMYIESSSHLQWLFVCWEQNKEQERQPNKDNYYIKVFLNDYWSWIWRCFKSFVPNRYWQSER